MRVTRAEVALMMAALVVAVFLGALAGRGDSRPVVLVAGVFVVLAARPVLIVWLAGAGVLVDPASWPLVTTVGPADLYVGDMLALMAVVAALIHGTRPLWRGGLSLVVLVGAWAAVRSELAGTVAVGRILVPLVVMLVVARALPVGYDLRRDLRWFPLITLGSVFALGSGLGRWTSLAGGANETALVGAVAVVLALTYRGGWRVTLLTAGAALLVGAAGITAMIAAGVGGLYWTVSRKPGDGVRRIGAGSLLLVLWLTLAAALTVPLLRLDLRGTIDAHLFQTGKFTQVITTGDPFFGAGWANVDRAAFAQSDILGLHNVYLDVFAYLGLVGFALFAALLVATWRQADAVGRSLLVVWAVWVNTTGAFPGSPWGLLGFALATAVLARSDEVPEQADDEALRGSGRGRVDADLDDAASRRGRL